jgi:hypothetical protein
VPEPDKCLLLATMRFSLAHFYSSRKRRRKWRQRALLGLERL